MIRTTPWVWCAALVALGPTGRAAEMPARARQPAQVVGTLTAPADDAMHLPTDVAVSPAGEVFVADGANDRVVRFAADGAFAGALKIPAHVGGLKNPVGLDVDRGGRVWIADTGQARIVVVDVKAGKAEVIPLPNAKENSPAEPTDVAVTHDGKRAYIVDNDNHRLIVRDNATGDIKMMGSEGIGLGAFRWPFMVAVDDEGYACVSEAIGARLQLISPRDLWAGQISRWGVELGRLYRPKGVAIDARHRIYASDSTLGVVQMFGRRGNVIGVLTTDTGEPLRFDHPMGICFDKAGTLHVVESKTSRVVMVDIEGTSGPREPEEASGKDESTP